MAEGERLYSNVLLQNFACLRAGSLAEGLSRLQASPKDIIAGIWVSFRGSPDMRPSLVALELRRFAGCVLVFLRHPH